MGTEQCISRTEPCCSGGCAIALLMFQEREREKRRGDERERVERERRQEKRRETELFFFPRGCRPPNPASCDSHQKRRLYIYRYVDILCMLIFLRIYIYVYVI